MQNGIIIVLKRGEEVMARLEAYAREHALAGGWVTGLGGAGAMTLGYYNLDTKEYEWHEYQEPTEIVNLTGNLAWVDGNPVWHVHGTFVGHDRTTTGGHVKSLDIALTCELHITPLEQSFTRAYDDETGLNLLKQT